MNDNTVRCWGINRNGRCNAPDSIQGKIVSITCGDFFSCALLNDGTIKCWGNNGVRQCNVPDSIQGKIMNRVQ